MKLGGLFFVELDHAARVQYICKKSGWMESSKQWMQCRELFVELWRNLKDTADYDDDGQITVDEWVSCIAMIFVHFRPIFPRNQIDLDGRTMISPVQSLQQATLKSENRDFLTTKLARKRPSKIYNFPVTLLAKKPTQTSRF